MSEEKNIKNFTAADIEKYWTGKLSASEMHAMEKAAMDDPFLADAMEGYKNKVNVDADVNTLRERLDKRLIALAPVVSIKQKKFPWLKVAAAIIIVGGMGLLVQQVVFKNRSESPIANTKNDQLQKAEPDTNNNAAVPPISGDIQGSLGANPPDSSALKAQQKAPENLNAITLTDKKNEDTLNVTASVTAKEFKITDEQKKDSVGNAVATADAERVTEKFAKISAEKPGVDEISKFRKDSFLHEDVYKDKNAVATNAKRYAPAGAVSQGFGITTFTNRYNYRVVDAQNNPVPFANVMNTRDNVGTYTDIKGNFNLVSSDSILNVQIRSLGYLSSNYKIVPSSQFKSLTLKEDFYARREILDSSRQVVSNAARKDTAELVEPEVGWPNYNTYIANNIQIPDNIRKKSTLTNVELSFDVDKSGNPVNIKVTKSSRCKECDDEAIRLLKEGPKWKKKGRRSKTTISIAVDQK